MTLLQHDPWFVAIAAAVCLLSGYMAQPILDRAAHAHRSVSWFWIVAGGLIVGSTVWSVHFIAILAMEDTFTQHHDLAWTLGSLLISILGMVGMCSSMRLPAKRHQSWIKGAIFVGAVSSMHYAGMNGVHGPHDMSHRSGIVMASIALAVIPAVVFVYYSEKVQSPWTKLARTGMFSATILIVHFGGVIAMVHTASPAPVPQAIVNSETFAMTVMLVTSMVFIFGASIVYLEKRNVELFEHRAHEGLFINHVSGTANRAGMVREIDSLIAKEQPFTLIGMSLIGFREARDLVGRGFLNHWIPSVARRIETVTRPSGTVGYAGGGWFYILQQTDEQGLSDQGIDMLRQNLGRLEMQSDTQSLTFETAMGIVHYPADAHKADDLVDYCDFAIECALDAGISTLARFEKDRLEERSKRHRLSVDIRNALRNGDLELYYQPQGRLDAATAAPQVSGFEALARWTHPKFGRIPPDVFVPLCETGGLNPELARWALHTACREFADWDTAHTVAVNVPPELLNGSGLIDMVRTALDATGLAPHRLEIEVTESGIIADLDAARLCIDALHDLGVRVSLDDFGTGNASLQTLFEIPLDKIKLDRMFLPTDKSDTRSTAIVEATAFIANRLGADVLAEGVETEEQLTLLTEIGYDAIQGYYIAPALPGPEARRRFLNHASPTAAAE